jgi:predicted metalloprotease with PDZ domain
VTSRCSVLVGLLALWCSTALAGSPPLTIDYEVRPLHDARDGYEITLRFKGDASGRSTLRIPGEWASAQHAERGIEALTVTTPDARLEDTDDANVKRIVHRPSALLTARYVLRQVVPGVPSATWTTQYLPLIQHDFLEWIGWTTWVVPVDDQTQVCVRMRFEGLPAEWNFASSFGLDPHAISYIGRMQNFRESIFVAGDFRLRSRPVRGGRLITAVRGDWPFRDSELADRVATIVDGERAFWNDATQRDFLVTLMPVTTTSPRNRSFTGTGLTRSFATWTTPIRSLSELDALFTHEYFHTWNAQGLGDLPEPEALMYWFSEGFTDYYTHQLRLRWKMLTLEAYAAEYDDVLRSLAQAREGELPNAEIGPRFFTEGRTIGKLPYWRGMLLAAKWDAEIRARSGGKRSLDDAMRALLAERRHGIVRLDATRVSRVMQAAGAVDAAGDIARDIDLGRRPVLAEGGLTDCIRIRTVVEPMFDAGFNSEATMRTRRVTGVDLDGPGYAAGLRDGQTLRSIDLQFGDVDRLARIGVRDGDDGPERIVAYRPVRGSASRQQVAVRDDLDAAARTACLVALRAE